MRVVLSTYGGRGSVEPMVALAVRLRELGAEVRVCAPPDEEFAQLLVEIRRGDGADRPVRPLVTTVVPGSAEGLAQRTGELVAAQFDTVGAAAEGCDALVATGPLPVTAGCRSVAEKLGIRYVHAGHQPVSMPSPHQPPPAWRGRPLPPGGSDNRELWDLDARNPGGDRSGAAGRRPRLRLHRQPVACDGPGLEPVAADGPRCRADRCVDAARRTPAAARAGGVPGRRPAPVYVGFASAPLADAQGVARATVEAIRTQGLRTVVSRGWAELGLIDGRDDRFAVCEVNQQALFARVAAVVHHGSAGTTTTAGRAGVPRSSCRRGRTNRTGPSGWPT